MCLRQGLFVWLEVPSDIGEGSPVSVGVGLYFVSAVAFTEGHAMAPFGLRVRAGVGEGFYGLRRQVAFGWRGRTTP